MMKELSSREVTELLAFNYIDSGHYRLDMEKESAAKGLRHQLEKAVKHG